MNDGDNLYPSCIRCNRILTDHVFGSIEEKRAYVTAKLNGENGWDALQALRESNFKAEKRKAVLQSKVPLAIVGGKAPANDLVVRYKKPVALKPLRTWGQAECVECKTTFEKTRAWSKFCSIKCRRDYHEKPEFVIGSYVMELHAAVLCGSCARTVVLINPETLRKCFCPYCGIVNQLDDGP